MDVTIQKPDGTITRVSDLPMSSDNTEGLAPGVYAVADGWTPGYLTTGKHYKVNDTSGELLFSIIGETDFSLWCLWKGCPHLYAGNWRKVVVE